MLPDLVRNGTMKRSDSNKNYWYTPKPSPKGPRSIHTSYLALIKTGSNFISCSDKERSRCIAFESNFPFYLYISRFIFRLSHTERRRDSERFAFIRWGEVQAKYLSLTIKSSYSCRNSSIFFIQLCVCYAI